MDNFIFRAIISIIMVSIFLFDFFKYKNNKVQRNVSIVLLIISFLFFLYSFKSIF